MERSEGLISPLDRLCLAVATGLYLSYIPAKLAAGTRWARLRRWTGAGFLGTALGWALLYLLPQDGPALAAALAAGLGAACWTAHRAERVLGVHDDPRIIVDEVVGYWVAVAGIAREPGLLLAGFVLFRILDAFKLPPYRWLERLPGGLGIVMDDVGAGAAANLLLRAGLGLFR